MPDGRRKLHHLGQPLVPRPVPLPVGHAHLSHLRHRPHVGRHAGWHGRIHRGLLQLCQPLGGSPADPRGHFEGPRVRGYRCPDCRPHWNRQRDHVLFGKHRRDCRDRRGFPRGRSGGGPRHDPHQLHRQGRGLIRHGTLLLRLSLQTTIESIEAKAYCRPSLTTPLVHCIVFLLLLLLCLDAEFHDVGPLLRSLWNDRCRRFVQPTIRGHELSAQPIHCWICHLQRYVGGRSGWLADRRDVGRVW